MAYLTQTHGLTASVVARLNALADDIALRIARRRAFKQTLRELSSLDARALSDLGLHRSQIHRIAYEAAYMN